MKPQGKEDSGPCDKGAGGEERLDKFRADQAQCLVTTYPTRMLPALEWLVARYFADVLVSKRISS